MVKILCDFEMVKGFIKYHPNLSNILNLQSNKDLKVAFNEKQVSQMVGVLTGVS